MICATCRAMAARVRLSRNHVNEGQPGGGEKAGADDRSFDDTHVVIRVGRSVERQRFR
jgi:hypothetical protein